VTQARGSADDVTHPVIVMKFGGTSVATQKGRSAIAARVSAALELGKAPVVVVSAMGRRGAPYATDSLLELVDGLPPDERERDLLASVGEVISAVVVAHELRGAGINAAAYTGPDAGIATDGAHGRGGHRRPPARSAAVAEDRPVVCGFQALRGWTRDDLGRGAAIRPHVRRRRLRAQEVEIYTDVDGIMTQTWARVRRRRGPRGHPADELLQMANTAAASSRASRKLAFASGLSVRVRNTYSDHPGTGVTDIASYRPGTVATAVSHTCDIARFRVALPGDEGSPEHMGAQTRVYEAMADADVSLDMFTTVGDVLVFSVERSAVERRSAAPRRIAAASTRSRPTSARSRRRRGYARRAWRHRSHGNRAC
jgi:aspartate kinase